MRLQSKICILGLFLAFISTMGMAHVYNVGNDRPYATYHHYRLPSAKDNEISTDKDLYFDNDEQPGATFNDYEPGDKSDNADLGKVTYNNYEGHNPRADRAKDNEISTDKDLHFDNANQPGATFNDYER